MYPALKHSHLFFIVISLILFNFRVIWRFIYPERPLHKILKFVPHINDTLLLATGIAMIGIAGWMPFGAHYWLGVKIVLVAAYIAMGLVCLKTPARSMPSNSAYLAALLCFALIAFLARSKPF